MRIIPFKALHYNKNVADLDRVYLPAKDYSVLPFEDFNNYKYHSSRLIHPCTEFAPVSILRQWFNNGVVDFDKSDSFYVYRIAYTDVNGIEKERTGLVCLLEINAENPAILEHEAVIDWHIENLKENFKKNDIIGNFSMLAYDSELPLELFFAKSLSNPIIEIEDNSIKHQLSPIEDEATIRAIKEAMDDKKFFLLDGHHRYNALKQLSSEGSRKYYMLSVLYNIKSQPIDLLPFHRIWCGDFNESDFMEKLKEDFTIEKTNSGSAIKPEKGTFALVIKNNLYRLTLKRGKISEISWNFPEMILNLDQTIVHYFIFWKCLGVKGRDQKNSKNIKFCTIFADCVKEVKSGNASFAVILNEVDLDEIIKVAESGYRYPQKTSFFYPKTLSGLLFASAASGMVNIK